MITSIYNCSTCAKTYYFNHQMTKKEVKERVVWNFFFKKHVLQLLYCIVVSLSQPCWFHMRIRHAKPRFRDGIPGNLVEILTLFFKQFVWTLSIRLYLMDNYCSLSASWKLWFHSSKVVVLVELTTRKWQSSYLSSST